jgi:glycosyltransferase involved in cell wall biosynthesis
LHRNSKTPELSALLICFLIVVIIQLVYFAAFCAVFRKEVTRTISVEPQPVSVIVCSHDEEKNLRELIPALLQQDHPCFEVIIVNDRSNDGTFDYLREEAQKDSRLRTVYVDNLPAHANAKKYGITLAIRSARYEIILLTDADCLPASSKWIRTMSDAFKPATTFVVGYSSYLKQPGLLNLFIRYETLFTAIQYLSFALLGEPYMGVGRNLAYRKSFFLQCKGFNDLLPVTGGDDDLFVNRHARRENTEVNIEPDALVWSRPENTWRDFFYQKIRHLSTGKRYKFRHQLLLGIFNFSMLATWVMGIALLLTMTELIWVIPALLLRMGIVLLTVSMASKRVGHKFETRGVPFLDFLFVIYYISTGSVALVTKRVKWKT